MSTKTNVVRDEQFPILLPIGRGVQKYTLKAAKELLVNLSASIKIVEKRRANSEQGEPKSLRTTKVKTSPEEPATPKGEICLCEEHDFWQLFRDRYSQLHFDFCPSCGKLLLT